MRGPAAVLAEIGLALDRGAGGDFALEPGGERGLERDAAGGAEARDEGGGVVTRGVGEVLEVEGGLHGRVGAGEVEAPLGFGPWDVGRHAEGVDGRVVAESGRVEAEGDLVAVHHYVGDAGRVVRTREEDAGVGVHGRLVWGYGAV